MWCHSSDITRAQRCAAIDELSVRDSNGITSHCSRQDSMWVPRHPNPHTHTHTLTHSHNPTAKLMAANTSAGSLTVQPWLTFAPDANNNLTTPSWPCPLATVRAVEPPSWTHPTHHHTCGHAHVDVSLIRAQVHGRNGQHPTSPSRQHTGDKMHTRHTQLWQWGRGRRDDVHGCRG